ncbi:MAG: DNA methyltransferase [Caulobacter sp.]|nr:DNA methyltransferase [Caulobacter sp.]
MGNVNGSVAPLDVVYFAGVGGSSLGYQTALGCHPQVALNHWDVAIGVHSHNFPETEHIIADVFDVDPRCVRPGVKWRSFWASPDCRHFSKAKGGAPVSPRVRGLAWIVIKVAKLLGENAPDVIFLENVEEFVDWCPLGPDGKPDPGRKGETFRLWKRRLEQCGYVVEWRFLVAAKYGDPTTRKRLFLVARRDGRPILWPDETHAPREEAAGRGLKPYRAAAEIIDWSIPCPSIFLTQAECRERGIRAKRPLEEATLKRIAKGMERYVFGAAEPFIVPLTHAGAGRVYDVGDPLRTVTGAHRGEFAMVAPVIAELAHGDDHKTGRRDRDVREPLRTIHAGGGKHALVAPILTAAYGEREGQAPRSRSVEQPYPTVVANGNGGHLAAATLIRTDNSGSLRAGVYDPQTPLRTITSAGGFAVAAAFMEQANTGTVGHSAEDPLSTIVGRGTTQRLVTACLGSAFTSNTNGGGRTPEDPLKTVLAGGTHHYLLQQELRRPFAEHGDELRAFLIKYYGTAEAVDLAGPLHSVTSRARFGLVLVGGVAWQVVDIGMRMLTPAELAAAQGFPRTFVTGFSRLHGKVTKTDETKLIGNSVCTAVSAALIAANLGDGRWGAAEPNPVREAA